jgi:hypothetical protein
MSLLSKVTDLDPKEIIKLLLLFGTVAAGCQINRHDIRESTAESVEYVDENFAALQDSISILNRRVAALEKHPQRKVRKIAKPKPRLWGWIPFIGG